MFHLQLIPSSQIQQLRAIIKLTSRLGLLRWLPKHMVTIGLEGFYGSKAVEKSGVNFGEWAALLGTDFIQNSAVDGIDFASVHAYPDSWMPHANTTTKLNFILHWLDTHIADGENILKKPVLFTEVGYLLHVKGGGVYYGDTLLKRVYDRIIESAKKGQAGAGALIWQLLVEGMEEYGDKFSLVAWKHPSTYKLILEQSCKLKRKIFLLWSCSVVEWPYMELITLKLIA